MKVSIVLIFLSYIGCIIATKIENELLPCIHSKTLDLDVSNITVSFFDLNKGNLTLKPNSVGNIVQEILDLKNLDKNYKTFVFINDLNPYYKQDWKIIRNYFNHTPNSYLISIDYTVENTEGPIETYETAVEYVYYVGKRISQMLADLYKGGAISAKNVHGIGCGLGGQALGYVGENFFNATGQKIARITALDPAGQCFANSPKENQVRSGVAEYVEVYHCYTGRYGTTSVLGDVDFFVNQESQLNCSNSLKPKAFNSSLPIYNMCTKIWMESVTHPKILTGYKCDIDDDFKAKNISWNETTIAGFGNPGNATGVFCVALSIVNNETWVSCSPDESAKSLNPSSATVTQPLHFGLAIVFLTFLLRR